MICVHKLFICERGASLIEHSFLAATFSFMVLVALSGEVVSGIGLPLKKAGWKMVQVHAELREDTGQVGPLNAGGTEGTGAEGPLVQSAPAPSPTGATPAVGIGAIVAGPKPIQ